MLTPRPKVKLSILRDIGWREWDPIRLANPTGGWEGTGCEDEYDGYLLQAAGVLLNNRPDEEAVEHLVWAEAEHMGLGDSATLRSRASRTVELIKEYVATLPPGRVQVR